MKLEEVMPEVVRATEAADRQNAYVQQLVALIQSGEKVINIYDESLHEWTQVNLNDFWQIQYNKWLAMAGYAGDMNGLATNLQAVLDSAIATVVKPEDRTPPPAAKAE